MNSTDNTHTPTPWRFVLMGRDEVALWGNNGLEIGLLYGSDGLDEPYTINAIANASFIVRACNAHDELVEALVSLDARFRECGSLHTAEDAYDSFYQSIVAEAVSKARGEQP